MDILVGVIDAVQGILCTLLCKIDSTGNFAARDGWVTEQAKARESRESWVLKEFGVVVPL